MANYVSYQTEHGEVKLSPEIVKKYLVSGKADKVTDQELVMFIQLCKYQGLNPFLREAYLIKFGDTPATFVTGKDTFVKRAAKCELCAGYEAGVIAQKKDGSIEQRKGSLLLNGETLVGGWAKVFRKDWQVPLEITVSIDEYKRVNAEGKTTKNWNDMPATMIRKVALVQALREAMPEKFTGLYSPEEMPIDDSKLDMTEIQQKTFITEPQPDEPQTIPIKEVIKPKKEISTQAGTTDIISTAQAKRMFAIARGDADVVREVLNNHNYTSSKDVRKADYEAICDEIIALVGNEKTDTDVGATN